MPPVSEIPGRDTSLLAVIEGNYGAVFAELLIAPPIFVYGFTVSIPEVPNNDVGSMVPANLFGSLVVSVKSTRDSIRDQNIVQIYGVALPQTFFTSFTINGVTFLSAAADLFGESVPRVWAWSWFAPAAFLSVGAVNISFT